MAYGTTPDRTTLRRWLAEGMTHKAIAQRWTEETGENCTRTGVTMAVNRYSLSEKQPRYDDLIPWRVKAEHTMNPHVRGLRLLARRKRGQAIGDEEQQRLDSWLLKVKTADAVVHYDPDTEQGFWLVPKEPGDGDGLIRKPRQDE